MGHTDTTNGSIRAFGPDDAPAVAAMFEALLSRRKARAGGDLIGHLRRHYLEGPFAAADCPALVHVGPDGDVMGFGGRVVQSFAFDGRVVRAAILGNLMVRNHERTPTAGAALLRALAGGPQDLTLSETANTASLAMWRQLRGQVMDRHSLDFIRVLKPARAVLDMAMGGGMAAKVLLPLSRPIDRLFSTRSPAMRWAGLPAGFMPSRGIRTEPISAEAFAGIFDRLTRDDAGVPVWPTGSLPAVVAEASAKRSYGAPHLRAVLTAGGAPIGLYLFHLAAGGSIRVTEIVHAPGQAGPVLDALFSDAQQLGASYVRGRTRPQMLDALLGKKVFFASSSASVIRTRDAEIARAFIHGDVHFNGLVGERWTRFIGDRFDAAAPAAIGRPDCEPLSRARAGLAAAGGTRLET